MAQRKHKNTQKRFETLFAEGMSLHQASDFQAAAEKLLHAVYAAPLVWSKHRFAAFSAFLASLLAGSMTQSDIDLITDDFIDNENEPAHFRSSAAICVATWYIETGYQLNMNSAAELLRQGLDIIATSPKEDENRQVFHHPHIPLNIRDALGSNDVTLKSILCYLDEKARKWLSQLCPVKNSTNTPNILKSQQEILFERSRAGGMVCDCCGKTLLELQVTFFKRCSRCAMVFYCSPTCQRDHWKKKGHKKECREEGQIEIGDDMSFHTKQPDGTIHSTYVNVLSSLGGDLWQVKEYGPNTLVTVNGADLRRLRPPSYLPC